MMYRRRRCKEGEARARQVFILNRYLRVWESVMQSSIFFLFPARLGRKDTNPSPKRLHGEQWGNSGENNYKARESKD